MLRRLLQDSNRFNQLLGHAVRLQFGQIQEEDFRQKLDHFYSELEMIDFMDEINIRFQKTILNRPGGYKTGVTSLHGENGRGLWHKRFRLLHHLGIRTDLMILRRNEQIPPHGHYRVVSGFCLLEGEVGIRHYDRVREVGEKLIVRKVLDAVLHPGGYTTNSEYFQNIHWVYGLADVSFLFRVTVLGTPARTFGGPGREGDRVYIDPTSEPGDDGLIVATYITELDAKRLPFPRPESAVAFPS